MRQNSPVDNKLNSNDITKNSSNMTEKINTVVIMMTLASTMMSTPTSYAWAPTTTTNVQHRMVSSSTLLSSPISSTNKNNKKSLGRSSSLSNIILRDSFVAELVREDTASVNNDVKAATSSLKSFAYRSIFLKDMVAYSGMNGKALSNIDEVFPSKSEVRSNLPKECYLYNDIKTFQCLALSTFATAACTGIGIKLLSLLSSVSLLYTIPIWTLYSIITGTVAMGLWVLAHECGHNAFLPSNKKLQDIIGYLIHTIMFVPYFSWQRSHAIHHQYTNNIDYGETHVPNLITSISESSSSNNNDNNEAAVTTTDNATYNLRAWYSKTFGNKLGLKIHGIQQLIMHLGIGWPAYLLIGATGGRARGITNHFYPEKTLTSFFSNNNKNKKQANEDSRNNINNNNDVDVDDDAAMKMMATTSAAPASTSTSRNELFPGTYWKKKVYQSDVGIGLMITLLGGWIYKCGIVPAMVLYGGPLIVVNAWLVLYTWLQHTDVDVPHYNNEQHTYMKGVFSTIDRPYNKLDPWGIIDTLHHHIGTSHVMHHFDSTIPHYHGKIGTDAIKKHYPKFYLYDPTPIPIALWRICTGCTAVQQIPSNNKNKNSGIWVWKNNDIKDIITATK